MTAFDYSSVDWPKIFRDIDPTKRGSISAAARKIGMTRQRMQILYDRYRADHSYNPKNLTWGGSNRAFQRDEEREMIATIVDELGRDGYALPQWRIRDIFLSQYRLRYPKCTRRHSFSASNGWMYRLLGRHELSSRKSQKQRKSPYDEVAVKIFRKEMKKVEKMFPPRLIFNSDETPVRISPQSIYTTARRGSEAPHVNAQPGQKETITAIATVDGQVWPLTIVAQGSTPRCVRNLQMPQEIYRDFTPSGKSNKDVCVRHIERISSFAQGKPCCLIWDSYGSHWTPEVWDAAFKNKVRLEKVPENATHILQPLDTTIFAGVSSMHQSRLRREDSWNNSVLEAKRKAIESYNIAWKKVQRKTVHKAFAKMLG